ncbi:hypothetical protein IAT40_006371 [Kwoniella sp. CBS 6097]
MSGGSSASEDNDSDPSQATSAATEPINGSFIDKSTGSEITYTAISIDVTKASQSERQFNPSSIKWIITETDAESGESAKSTVSLTDLASSATTVLRAKKKNKEAGRKHDVRMEVYKRILGSDIDTKATTDGEEEAASTAASTSKGGKKEETVIDRDTKLERIFGLNADNGSKPLTTYRVTTDDPDGQQQSSTVTLYYTKKGGGGQGEFSVVRWDGTKLTHHAGLNLDALFYHCTEYGSTLEADKKMYTDANEFFDGLIEREEISKTAKPVAKKSKKRRK